MKTLDVSQANEALSGHAHAQKEPVVVTEHGRPLFVVLPVEGADLETVSLALSAQFQAFWQRSLRECPPGRGVPAEDVRRRFGLERAPVRKAG